MRGRYDFTDSEWTTLTRLPIDVAAAATIAEGKDNSGSTVEVLTALSALLAGVKLLRHNALVQSVFDDYKHEGHGEADILELTQNPPEGLVLRSLALAREAAAPLSRVPEEVASEFKFWIRNIAADIVTASSTGGFLGIGGQVVTEAEEAYLDRLTTALGIARG